jgi:hypothetical protein
LGRTVTKPLARALEISEQGAAALVFGLICGFPVGCRSALSLYENGEISKGELEHILCFCNIPGSAFLISAVGVGMFGSLRFGVLLYAVHILSALTVGAVSKRFFRTKKKRAEPYNADIGWNKREGYIAAFTRAVSGSASNMLVICAFIVFFSAVTGMMGYILEGIALPDSLSALLLGVLEMTGGVRAAGGLSRDVAPMIAAVITGWSGLSIAFQFVGVCGDHGIRLRPYMSAKAFCGILNGVLIWGTMHAFGEWIEIGGKDSVPAAVSVISGYLAPIAIALFIGGCALTAWRIRKIKG